MSYHIDLIKSRINISSIISKQVNLKKKSNGEYIGLCPFHNEKSPSFNVSDNKGFYHCFGCGVHGDIFSYLIEYDRMSFSEALKELATNAQVELPKFSTQQQAEVINEQEIILSINEIACQHFTKKLFSNSGKVALEYFRSRRLGDDIISEYRLGYCDHNVDDLLDILKAKFSLTDILKAKIINEGNYGLYNHFKNRVIFPIHNRKNQVIAFGGRILNDTQPKYLNSAETIVFNKSYTLYGYNQAISSLRQHNKIIVVEGYMDVLSLVQNGINNVVAPLGTSITSAQIKLLWQRVNTPQICLDADAAGQKASLRVAKEVLPHLVINKSIEFINLNDGKDPDEVIKAKGVNHFNTLIKNSIPLSEFIFQQETNSRLLNIPENMAALKNQLQEIANQIKDQNIKFAYNTFFKNKFYELVQSFRKNHNKYVKPKLSLSSLTVEERSNLEMLASFFVKFPTLILDEEVFDAFDEASLETNFLDKARDSILNLENLENIDISNILKQIMKVHFEIEFEGSRNETIDNKIDLNDTKNQIMRISRLNTLSSIRDQIKIVTDLLYEKQDEATFRKLSYLKSHEEKLRTELNLIN